MNIAEKSVVQNVLAAKGAPQQKARVKFYIDRSVSIRKLFNDGVIQAITERIFPIAAQLDDDGAMEVSAFADFVTKIQEPMTANNYSGYIDRNFDAIEYGGTKYAPVFQAMMRDSGATVRKEITYMKGAKRGGFMGISFLGGKDSRKEAKETIMVNPGGTTAVPVLAFLLTDGDNDRDDKDNAIDEIIRAAKYPVFIHCIPLKGDPTPDYAFIKGIDTMKERFIDNVGANREISALDFVSRGADDLFSMLLTPFMEWTVTAKDQFLIR